MLAPPPALSNPLSAPAPPLAPGHGAVLRDSRLHLTGYERMGLEQVSTFRDFGSRCEGHPERDLSCGIDNVTQADYKIPA